MLEREAPWLAPALHLNGRAGEAQGCGMGSASGCCLGLAEEKDLPAFV